ncbi:MAG: ABC transporter substrate-binding protein [Planctomycetota bacterium]|nr:ABC transporter substrate-binding protein [Planctomycetota bacterium]
MRSLHRATVVSLLAAVGLCLLVACERRAPRSTSVGVGAIEPPLRGTPQRIVPATAAAAEYLAALVEPQRIAALPEQVDDFATRDFRGPPFGSLPRFAKYTAERLLALEPDLVITLVWQNQDTTTVLRGQGIPVLVLRSGEDYASVRETLALLGNLLGAEARAAEITRGLDARAAALGERARARPKRRALVYSNDGTGGWAAGARTTAGALLELCGLVNAGAEDGIVEHQQIDLERVLRIAPDLFVCGAPVRAEGGSATRAVLLASAPLGQLKAVRDERIAVIPSVLLSADSPALLDAAEALEREILRLYPESK